MPTIKLYANLRNIAGVKELSIPGASLRLVISELIRLYPALEGVILDDGQTRRHVVITINGRNATDLEAAVTEDDVVAIFPPIAGGSRASPDCAL